MYTQFQSGKQLNFLASEKFTAFPKRSTAPITTFKLMIKVVNMYQLEQFTQQTMLRQSESQ